MVEWWSMSQEAGSCGPTSFSHPSPRMSYQLLASDFRLPGSDSCLPVPMLWPLLSSFPIRGPGLGGMPEASKVGWPGPIQLPQLQAGCTTAHLEIASGRSPLGWERASGPFLIQAMECQPTQNGPMRMGEALLPWIFPNLEHSTSALTLARGNPAAWWSSQCQGTPGHSQGPRVFVNGPRLGELPEPGMCLGSCPPPSLLQQGSEPDSASQLEEASQDQPGNMNCVISVTACKSNALLFALKIDIAQYKDEQ